jgi:hypothetical protein
MRSSVATVRAPDLGSAARQLYFDFDAPMDDVPMAVVIDQPRAKAYAASRIRQRPERHSGLNEPSRASTAPVRRPLSQKQVVSNKETPGNARSRLWLAHIPGPTWDPNDTAASCARCSAQFFMLWNRRHHCRFCGYAVCGDCSPNRSAIPAFGILHPVRICTYCLESQRFQVRRSSISHETHSIL